MQDERYIGRNIHYLRNKEGLTQKEFCALVGISTKTLSRYESGEYLPPIDVLMNLSRLKGVKLDELIYSDLSMESEDEKWTLGRKPKVCSNDYSVFEKQMFFVYYLSENVERYRTGKLTFDDNHDTKRLFLHGTLKMHHSYDCKLVIDERNALIYATGIKAYQRAVIVLHFPDFEEERKHKYRGGLGVIIHRDTYQNQSAQRICLLNSSGRIMDKPRKEELIEFLSKNGEYERITVSVAEDGKFNEWIMKKIKN